ncbi:MAG: DUF1684 domain-containing protein [Actinobacteria bacterium]|nr:DUF1684 domain-containing protein [Actinomycetota bacterium]MCA1720417.1 DUF1684 domain-containing protein [Actinomycetota bacterium]
MNDLSLLDWRRRVADLYAAIRADDDPARALELWRRTRDELFASHPQSPGPGPLDIAPYDERWRAVVEPQPAEPYELRVETGTDGTVVFDRIAVLATPWGPLDLWQLRQYGGGLWLPLKDASPRTYGGGRYLLDTVKGADLGQVGNALVLDLNFLYAPSCAHDPAWACPLAPPGNVLDVPVEAGELSGR